MACMACAGTAAAGADPAVVLTQGPVALNLSGPAPKDLTSGASLNLNLPEGAVQARATASIGKEDGDTAYWHKDEAQIEAQLAGPLGSALQMSGGNTLALTYRPPESASDSTPHVLRTETQAGHASLSLASGPVRLILGGDTASRQTEDAHAAPDRSAVHTADHSAYADVAWQPAAWLRVEGGSAAQIAGISWQDAATRTSSYASVDPHVAVTVTPWRDAVVSAKLAHSVSPYDATAFADYSRADRKGDASGFQPDHAWQLEARMQQQVGPASLSATYTASRQGTATEFAEIEGVQAPATTPLLSRDRVAVAIEVPLAAMGLPRTQFSSQATWQSSRVLDPVTLKDREASGETPYQLSFRLSHTLPERHLSLGFNGGFAAASTSYRVSELSTTTPGGSLGAFVAYKPGDYEIDLNFNGLVGSETSSGFFNGPRGEGEPVRTAVQDNSGPMLSLSLKKPL